MSIELRHASNRSLEYAGSRVGLAISALKYVGKEGVTTAVIEKVKAQLTPREFEQLSRATSIPSWLRDRLYPHVQQAA
jgi:hypothetical protein